MCAYLKNIKFTQIVTTAECYLGYPIILIFKLGLASKNCNYSLYNILYTSTSEQNKCLKILLATAYYGISQSLKNVVLLMSICSTISNSVNSLLLYWIKKNKYYHTLLIQLEYNFYQNTLQY